MICKILTFLFALALVLTACQSAPANEEGELPAETPLTPTNTALTPSATIATAEDNQSEPASPVRESQCTVVSRLIETDPAAESPFPPVSDTDWLIGPETAAVTMIEYSDFQ